MRDVRDVRDDVRDVRGDVRDVRDDVRDDVRGDDVRGKRWKVDFANSYVVFQHREVVEGSRVL